MFYTILFHKLLQGNGCKLKVVKPGRVSEKCRVLYINNKPVLQFVHGFFLSTIIHLKIYFTNTISNHWRNTKVLPFSVYREYLSRGWEVSILTFGTPEKFLVFWQNEKNILLFQAKLMFKKK